MDQLSEDLFGEEFDKFCNELKNQGKIDETSKAFSTKCTDVERMEFLLDLDGICDHIVFPNAREGKCSSAASRLRNEGNQLFQQKLFKGAVIQYTRGISKAPQYRAGDRSEGDSDLALGYANRSAALFHLGLWEACLSDITNAFESSYPAKLMHKLHLRRGQCLMKLNKFKEAISELEAGKKALEDSTLDSRKRLVMVQDFDKSLNTCEDQEKNSIANAEAIASDPFQFIECHRLQPEFDENGCNSIYKSLAEFCEVSYTAGQGRFIVAKREIFPGEIVLIEKPYASVLLPEHSIGFCHHCYAYCQASIPCSECSEALYCSQKCRQLSWETYHQHECAILPVLFKSGVGKFGHLAVRTILASPLKELVAYRNEILNGKLKKHETPLLDGCNEQGLYNPTYYQTICSLLTHDSNRVASDLFRRATMALFLLRGIQLTKYINQEILTNNKDFLSFIGGLILSHLQSFPCNAHEIAEFELNVSNLVESTPIELGAGIYSTLSLFNHSCDPGVNRNFYGDICVVRAIKTIKAGEEIADNYGAVYAVEPKAQRQEKLRPQYFFECRCRPCVEDWPLYPAIEHMKPTWKCSACWQTATEHNNIIHCEHCNLDQTVDDRLALFTHHQDAYEMAFEELMTCKVDTALPGLLSYLRELDRNICLPWREYNNCQEAVKQCFSIMGNCHIINSPNCESK